MHKPILTASISLVDKVDVMVLCKAVGAYGPAVSVLM